MVSKENFALKKDLFNIDLKSDNQINNPAQYNEIKKSIARLYTTIKIQNDKKSFKRYSYKCKKQQNNSC